MKHRAKAQQQVRDGRADYENSSQGGVLCGRLECRLPASAHEERPVSRQFFEKPILNSPSVHHARHWALDQTGQPTQQPEPHRLLAQFVSPSKKVSSCASDPYKSLKTTLKADINAEAWESLHSDMSRAFDKPSSGRIAVKVINHLGDEVMKVFRVGN